MAVSKTTIKKLVNNLQVPKTAVPDDGVRITFESGAVRSPTVAGETGKHPARYDLLNPIVMRRMAETMGEGAIKYGDHNWWKGMSEKVLLNHGLAHIFAWMKGDRTEDHLSHAMWNLGALMQFEETRPELLDLQAAISESGFYLSPGERKQLLSMVGMKTVPLKKRKKAKK